MRPQKVHDSELMQGLISVFRAKGYDGASMTDLAGATGLKKASLYHRFPDGKKEMTTAVLNHIGDWVNKNLYFNLVNEELELNERLDASIENIREIYKGGQEGCMYRSLSMDNGIELFGEEIKQGINQWLDGFIKFGKASGMNNALAKKNANQTFIDVQGSLVLSKSMGTTKPFEIILEEIRHRYSQTEKN